MGSEGDGVSIHLSRIHRNEESEKRLHIHFSLSCFMTTMKRCIRACRLTPDSVHSQGPIIVIAFILPIMTATIRQVTKDSVFRHSLVAASQSVAAGDDGDDRRSAS